MKNEILCFLPNSDEPITAKRLTAQIFPPYSASKSAEVSKILEVLLSEGKVANCRIPGVNNIGWYSLNNLEPNCRIDTHTIYKVLHSLRNNGNDISFYLKREMLRCIRNSEYPITQKKILNDLQYLNIFFNTVIPSLYLQDLELENKIVKIKRESSVFPAWRLFDPLLDTVVEIATNSTNTAESKALEKGFCLSDDNKTLYISIFSIHNNNYESLKKIIKSHTGDCVIIDFPKDRKKFVLDDKKAFILSKSNNEKHLSYIEKFLERFPETPGHIELAKKIVSSRRGKRIDFENLSEISDEVALIFSNFKGTLSLDSVKKLSDSAAQALSKLKDRLYLYRLDELSDSPGHVKLAESLARRKTLYLPNLLSISSAAAGALARHEGDDLNFYSLERLDSSPGHIKLAERLARQDTIDLSSLVTLSPQAAEQLSRCAGDLIMPAIEGLSDTESHINLGVKLLKQKYHENGDFNKALDEEEDKDNSNCSVSRIFKKITPILLKNSFISNLNISIQDSIIDDKLADALCAHKGNIELSGLEELTDSESHIRISRRIAIQETVYLNSLKKMSLSAAVALSRILELYLDGLQQIDKQLSSALSKNIGILSLNGITSLTDECAIELSNHNGFLFLNGLTSLTASDGHLSLAKKLSRQDFIELKNLKRLSSEAADLFCNCPGDILLPYSILGKSPEHLKLRIKISKQSFLIP